uniref:G-protein coupled receptors family 1 profile domain-containing protein n=1 Tax=Anguilla anguilla TaxID=7936 RepID=A0A0E9WNE1_ANGAN
MLWTLGSSFWLPHLVLAIILIQVNLGLICPQALFQNSACFFRYFTGNCNLAILFLQLTSGFHFAV